MDVVFTHIAKCFKIERLRDFQKECLNKLHSGCDVLVSYNTGSGKSLCYEAYPLFKWLHGDTRRVCVVIIAPLLSIMEQQATRLTELGYKATYIGRNSDDNGGIKQCEFTYLFSSPEHLLASNEWRSMLLTTAYQESHILLVIDEAHTVLEWYVFTNS
jgi:ATP-dependent DNA helicase RecQ